jgi:hypothetical protein
MAYDAFEVHADANRKELRTEQQQQQQQQQPRTREWVFIPHKICKL